MADRATYRPYDQPTGGWGSVKSLIEHATRQRAVGTGAELMRSHNKPGGYMCTSCAWAKPSRPHAAEFCENGAKATFWDLTAKRATPAFFADHTLDELRSWSDYQLESEGRLTHPLRYDPDRDVYVETSWEAAFAEIGATLKTFDPKSVIFYASGRASLETSYMYQLFARLYGNNNLPDSSNMCHETTSVALPPSIGTPVGTVLLEDFRHTDCILSFGQNVGTNAPRMLHDLQEASERGVPMVVFNPLRERGWEAFVSPQRPGQMLTNQPTRIATQYYQVRAGGDLAAMIGMAKALIEWDDEARSRGEAPILDDAFIRDHTAGFEAFREKIEAADWDEVVATSGLSRAAIEAAALTYSRASAVIAVYGMGLTQHRLGVEAIQMLVNLLLMRGQIGKPGAGICPVRGHSNVQGQRTVGISEKTKLVPLDRLAEQFGFAPPREDGMTTVDVCEGIVAGRVKAFIGLGGNFLRAVPDHGPMERHWTDLDLSVQVATHLNRTHLFPGRTTFLLPTIVRSEIDRQTSGPQIVTVEDSTTCIHASRGKWAPASEQLLSEPAIVAGLAKATLPPNPLVPWDAWTADYALVRDAIEVTFPEDFRDFNGRLDTPGGFPRPIPARRRVWETDTGRANFKLPDDLTEGFEIGADPDVLRLVTVRSNDQFNTTVYGFDDRLRGISGSRMILMINRDDRIRLGVAEGADVRLTTEADDGVVRSLAGLQVIDYDLPPGTCAGYFPECNVLIPLWHHDRGSKTPASKSVPVRVSVDEAPPPA